MNRQPATAPTSSARIARAERAAALASTLRRSLCEYESSHSLVALALGVSRQKVDEYCDAEGSAELRAADIAALPAAVARDVLRSIADALGFAVVALPGSAQAASSALAVARVAREAGEAVGEALEASADGSVSPAEGARIERECDDLIAAALELREHAREAQRVAAPTPIRRVGR